jgi:hypothetical protein
LLVRREITFMAVEMNLVGEHPDAQLRPAFGQREESSLQPDRQQHQRQIAGAQQLHGHGGARCGNGDGALEVIRHFTTSVNQARATSWDA